MASTDSQEMKEGGDSKPAPREKKDQSGNSRKVFRYNKEWRKRRRVINSHK